jgi:hypothetical protein
MRFSATLAAFLCHAPLVSADSMECVDRAPGSAYVLTVEDWADLARVDEGVRTYTDPDVGLIDLRHEEDGPIKEKAPGIHFRDEMGKWVYAYQIDGPVSPNNGLLLLVELDTPVTCSNGVVQCPKLVLSNDRPRQLLLAAAGHCVFIGEGSRHGMRDIIIRSLDHDYIVRDRLYGFDGAEYHRIATYIVAVF